MSKYNDRQRLNFVAKWNAWTDGMRAAIDIAIDEHRDNKRGDVTQCCLDCGEPCAPCDCRDGCPGGNCDNAKCCCLVARKGER